MTELMLLNQKLRKSLILFLFLIFLTPSYFSVNAVYNQGDELISPLLSDDKIHYGFLYEKGLLAGFVDIDTYIVRLKADKEYYFYAKSNYPEGLSISMSITGSGGSKIEFGSWDNNDPKSMRKIVYTFIPSNTDNYSLIITKADFSTDEAKYTLYANRSGFAGYWWMIFCGLLIFLLLLILPIYLIFRRKKGKRRYRRR